MLCVTALTISPWPDVCIWSNYYWLSLPGVYDIKTKLIGLTEHYPPCHHSPSIKLWFERLTQSLLLSSRVRTWGELWRGKQTVCLGLLFLPLDKLGDCLFAWGVFYSCSEHLTRRWPQVAKPEGSAMRLQKGRVGASRKALRSPPKKPSAGCLQGVLLASCRQHQLFFSVSPWPDNNIPVGHLIALLGHGLYYACLMDN